MENIPNQDQTLPTQNSLPPLDSATSNLSQADSQQQPVKNTNYWKIAVGCLLVLVVLCGVVLAYTMMNKPAAQNVIVQQTPTVQPTSSPATSTSGTVETDSTTNWKTYVDPIYSYVIKYPANWYIKPSQILPPLHTPEPAFIASYDINSTIAPTDPKEMAKQTEIAISVSTKQSNVTLSQWLSQKLSLIINQKNIKIGQVSGIQTEENPPALEAASPPPYTVTRIYLPNPSNSNQIYVFAATPSNSKFIETFDQMLSTFKFAGQSNNSDQQAVTNVVKNFYNSLTNQDGKTLFRYMTPALTVDEESNYSWLTGADLAPDTYRVFLRIKISDPQIKNVQKLDDTTYQVATTDQIQGYSNADPIGWSKPTTRSKIVMIIVNSNGKWLVDKFTDESNTSNSGNAATPKYSGFGQ